jgi:hypothetical protein
MGITYSTCLFAETFDRSTVSVTDVRFAFVVHLPFRLRVGASYRQDFEAKNRHFSLWLRNRVNVLPDSPGFLLLQAHPVTQLWTEAVLVLHDPVISELDIEPIRQSASQELPVSYPRPKDDYFNAMEALNHFIVGYATVSNAFTGGAPLRLFRPMDFSDVLRWDITILQRRNEPISDQLVQMMFGLQPDKKFRTAGSIVGDLHDLPGETLSGIGRAIELHRDFVFYESAFEARAKMFAGDAVGALLMAVSALEGAHAAYVHGILASRLPDGDESPLPAEFLRVLGMNLCNQLTPYIFMEADQRPNPDLIAQAEKALRYRNEIMHALRNKSGTYRWRTRSAKDLSDAYASAVALYEFYRSAFERFSSREGNQPS